ncbi:unnamed protein product [Nezara viridula]|uniref:Uncharacterized protein n=1 Tax=Nezara viridula TaxID=85310 RepID=A0A9P0HAG3_NEZVI|nr:unnamed protein product [Nezara viridula]
MIRIDQPGESRSTVDSSQLHVTEPQEPHPSEPQCSGTKAEVDIEQGRVDSMAAARWSKCFNPLSDKG